jgi:methylase of polypeptide subunit release factors
LEGKVIFEPCCGNGAIVKYLEKKGLTVISRDLYTTDEKHDYLVEEDPEYDVIITNPPFCVKHEFFNKAILSVKPFIMLLPIQFLTAKKSYENILNCKMDLIIFNPSPVFINKDQNRAVGDCAWMIVNLTAGGAFSVQRL